MSAVRVSASRWWTAARTRTAAIPVTAKANSAFSSPLVVQMVKDGMAAVSVPATTVTRSGRRTKTCAAANMAVKMPKQHTRATALGGYKTTSESPNNAPRSNNPSNRPMARIATHAGFE